MRPDIKTELLAILCFAQREKPSLSDFINCLEDAVLSTPSDELDIHMINDQELLDILSILAMCHLPLNVEYSTSFIHLAMLEIGQTYDPISCVNVIQH